VNRRRYLRILGLVMGLSLCVVGGFNILVDPYGYFRVVDLPHWNRVKPYPDGRAFSVKLAQMARLGPSALILGNSRAEIGFDPGHPAFATKGLRAYNAALPGTGVAEAREMFIHAQRAGPVQLTIIGLDFLDFLENPNAAPEALEKVDTERRFQQLRERFSAILSADAFASAIRTLGIQKSLDAPTLTEQGFNPLFGYDQIAATEGYYNMFLQRAQENARIYLRLPRSLDGREPGQSPSWIALRDLTQRSVIQGGDLYLIIYPYHAQILLLFEESGLWELFEEWKRRLVALVEEVRQAYPSARVTLWDFSGYHSFATEPVPGPGDLRTKVRWYWEAGHFKKELGNAVLDRVLGTEQSGESTFGAVLEDLNLDGHLERIRDDAAVFRRQDSIAVLQAARAMKSARSLPSIN
jgi:hypothetical protein